MALNFGTGLVIESEIVQYLSTQGYIDAHGEFVDAKFNDVPSILGLVAGVEAILKKHGVAIPTKVDQILQVVPLLAGLFT